jgi:hypothetical protein
MVFLAETLLGPLDGDLVIAGEGIHPIAVIVGAPAEQFLADDRNFQNLPKEEHDLFGPGQSAEVAVNDDAVEAVVYKNQQVGEQLCEEFHRSSVLRSCLDNSIIGPATGGIKISNIFG